MKRHNHEAYKAQRLTDLKAEAAKGTRHVFNTDEIPHLWMHKAQSNARNKAHNLYFIGAVIYSSGEHFPIASHMSNGKEKAILFTSRISTKTTAKHMAMVHAAIPAEVRGTLFHVPELRIPFRISGSAQVKTMHTINIASYQSRIDAEYLKSIKARKYKSYALNTARQTFEEAQRYIAYFRLRGKKFAVKLPESPEQFKAMVAERERIEAAAIAKRNAEAEKVNAAYIARQQGAYDAWKAGETNFCNFEPWRFPVAMRVVNCDEQGNSVVTVQTSRGASFPATHALKAYILLAAYKRHAKDYKRNGHTIHLGPYCLDSFNGTTGELIAGCHRVEWSEIERIGERLAASSNQT